MGWIHWQRSILIFLLIYIVSETPIIFYDKDGKEGILTKWGTSLQYAGAGLMGVGLVALGTGGAVVIPSAGTSTVVVIGGVEIFFAGGTISIIGGILKAVDQIAVPSQSTKQKEGLYIQQSTGKKAQNSNKNERHGDSGRAKLKAEKQIKDLEQKARESKSKRERTQIENKIRNIRNNAAKKQRGEEHSKGNKR